MTDTAQPGLAAENVALDDAAHAFKVSLGQAETVERPRDEKGRFAAPEGEEQGEEIEAGAEAVEAEEPVENDVEQDDEGEAAEEAQPEPKPLPTSWGADKAEEWNALPANVQEIILERDAEALRAVNQKFQEAANVRKANEAIVTEAQTNRQRFAEAAEWALALVQPQKPNPNDYMTAQGFDQASYATATYQYEQLSEVVSTLQVQRDQALAQARQEQETEAAIARQAIEQATRPGFLADVPAVTDPNTAPSALNEIVSYAVRSGIPEDVFNDPDNVKEVTSAQLHILWKAMKYDEQRAAQAKVKTTPKPEPRKPQPVVKPGVATPRAAVERQKMSGAMDRLAKSGSVEDGAAVLKQLFKGR